MTAEQERSVFIKLYRFLQECRGEECSDDFAKMKFSNLSSFKRSVFSDVCNKIELHHIKETDLKEAIVISLIKGQDWWDNLNNERFLYQVHERYFSEQRFERDEKTLEKFCQDGGLSIKDIFNIPRNGQSVACAFLRELVIAPNCYIAHLNEAVGGEQCNEKQVETDNIITALNKEVTNGYCQKV